MKVGPLQHCIVWLICASVSYEPVAFICRLDEAPARWRYKFSMQYGISLPDYLGHCSSEDGGKNLLQNIATSLPYNTDLRATSL